MHDWLATRFELSRGAKNNNRPMEGLRGLAVLLVFFVHYVALVDPYMPAAGIRHTADALHTMGHSGVDLFFVLSGYLIYGSLIGRPQNFFRFMKRRIDRIYPTFTAVFVVYLVLSFVFPAENKIPPGWVAGTVYVVENYLLLPGIFPIEAMITVAWSLSYEMFFYLVVPLAVTGLGLRERTRGFRVAVLLLVSVAIAVWCATLGGAIRMVMFSSGMLLYEAMKSSAVPRARGWVSDAIGTAFAVSGLAFLLAPLPEGWGYTLQICWLFVAYGALCFVCFTAPDGLLARAFSWTPARWLGNMSYSYYLIHGLTLKAIFLVLPKLVAPEPRGAGFFFGLMPLAFAATLLVSAGLFLMVERPFSLASKLKRDAAKART